MTPARLAPDYRRAIVLGSGGVRLWTLFEAARGARMLPADNPLDAFCERQVGRFLSAVRAHDPHAQSAFPFRHERQIVPFSALLAGMDMLRPGPFGLAVDPVYGPWLAWRGVVFTSLELPVMPPLPQPCERCSAPCVAACPAEAVHTAGFDWKACGTFRLTRTTCRETCHARLACPVGTAHRYSDEQMRYHYVAGLRELEQSSR